jgi:hypothetical protein
VLAGTRFTEEGVEGIIATPDGLVRRHLAIRLNAVLQAKELPARISDLDAGLADVEAESFTHGFEGVAERERSCEFESKDLPRDVAGLKT